MAITFLAPQQILFSAKWKHFSLISSAQSNQCLYLSLAVHNYMEDVTKYFTGQYMRG